MPIIEQTGNNLSNYFKPVLAFVTSILIFAGFTYLVDVELLNFIQTRFYNPSVVNSYVKENTVDAELVLDYIVELQDKFSQTLTEPAVRSSFLYNQSASDIFERSRIFGVLLESTGGLQSVQFIDLGGTRIHFSTSARDIISQSASSTSFRNYNEDPNALPYDIVSVIDGGSAKYTMDDKSERIIFSFPFHDSMDVYRGTALFNISVRTLAEKLIAEGRLNVSDNVSIIREPSGILLGSPETSKLDISEKVAQIWNEGTQGRVVLDTGDSGAQYSLISFRSNNGIFFGRLINDYLFSISEPMKLILNLSIFLTFFLTLFFVLNLKPNPATVVRNRLKRLRDNLFEQLYVNKTNQERIKWILELEQRRDGIRQELKYNMKLNSRMEEQVDSIIDKSWDELLAVLKSGSVQDIPLAQIKAKAAKSEKADDIDDIEEIEEAEAIEEAEEIEEVEAEAEAFEEIEEVEEIGEISEADEIEEIEEIDEIGEIEDLEDIEEIEEIGEAEAVPAPVFKGKGKGLLGLADKKAASKGIAPKSGKGLLGRASSKAEKKSAKKGLLSLASEAKPSVEPVRKGLLALASEIEFSRDYPVNVSESPDLPDELDIVSPFSSMFSSLDESLDTSDDDSQNGFTSLEHED